MHPDTGRSRVRADPKIMLRVTRSFPTQQISTNLLNKDLETAVVDENSHVMLEPQRDDFPTYNAYETARLKYLHGRKVRPAEC